ncbi:hypothetical protein [Calothrix sp. NIES-2098]|uniref:hypothetical protein n=1 Tax=Calothrix sp. NIES-2098 TaxID=1954171 RepID=UPI000B5E46FC|nr:hypothetical protein NIES2098_24060 [Calothrix sp. NIES-2098]
MNMQLINKIEKPILKNARAKRQLKQQPLQVQAFNNQHLGVEKKPELVVLTKKSYQFSVEDNSLNEGVGNSGWQVSDIWRDVRFDDF